VRELNFSTTIMQRVHAADLVATGRVIATQVREEGTVCAGEGASPEEHCADRTSGVRVVDADEAARGGSIDGHFRDNGNAHVRADHREETGEVAALKNDAGVKASAIAGGNGGFAETVSIAEQKERIEAKVGEAKRRSTGQFVLFGKRGQEAFRKKRKGLEVVAADGQSQNGKIDGAGAETVEQDGSNFLGDGELDLGKFTGERSEQRRKEIGRDGGNDADGQRTADRLLTLDDITFGGGEFVEDRTSARQEGFAEFGKADGTAKAVEQASAKFVFQLENLLGERRLRDVALLGRAGEGVGVGDSTEVAKLLEFHCLRRRDFAGAH
jgi:hypothetical protein